MFYNKKYQIQDGDTLIGIARKFGLPSYRVIYDHPANGKLKTMRGAPENILPGDILEIPPHPVIVLEYQLAQLNKLRSETEQMYTELLQQAEEDYRKITRIGSNVDLAAGMAQLGMSYGKIVKGGYDTMKLSGEKLARANRALAKSSLTVAPEFVAEQVIAQSAFLQVTGEEGLALAVSKIIVNSWFDMTSPSYWAKRITGVNPEQVFARTRQNILDNKAKAMHHLDGKINATRNAILNSRQCN